MHEEQPAMLLRGSRPGYFEYVQFSISVLFLCVVVLLGIYVQDAQYNIMFLALLSLAAGAFFVFLPVSAELDLRWLRATSGAAIFGATMWLTVPNAQKHNENHDPIVIENNQLKKDVENFKDSNKLLNDNNSVLLKENTEASDRFNKLQADYLKVHDAADVGNACTAESAALKNSLIQIRGQLNNIISATTNTSKFVEAAKSNTSDAPTCTLRSAQALGYIGNITTATNDMGNTISTALGEKK
jgi:hypothetical protein